MSMPSQIKICGITNQEDLLLVAEAGADYGGVLVEIVSPRSRTLEQARELFSLRPLSMVALTRGQSFERNREIAEALSPFALQLHGYESVETVQQLKQAVSCEIWKVFHLPAAESGEEADTEALLEQMERYAEAGADRLLVDASVMVKGERQLGGTGKTVDWVAARRLLERVSLPLILAGGLNPDNVAEAVRTVSPFAVDVSTGLEASKGKKDPDKVRNFVWNVRNCH